MSNLPIANGPGRIPVSLGSGVIYTADPASTPALDFVVTDAANDKLTTVLTLDHETTRTPASGIGTRLAFNTENSANESIQAGSISARLTTVTAAAPVGKFELATLGAFQAGGAYAVRNVFSATYSPGGAVYVFGVNDNVSGGNPLNFTILGASAFGGSGDAGAAATISGGTGDGASPGGLARLAAGVSGGDAPGANIEIFATNAGAAGATNLGGSVVIDAGDGGGDGAGGVIAITSGDGHGSGAGGEILLLAGNGGATGIGGAARVIAGDAGASGASVGGDIEITAGKGNSAGKGGSVIVSGGIGGGSGDGGDIVISGGDAGGSASDGGNVTLSGGVPTSTGNGGGVEIIGEDAVDAAGVGGTIVISPGQSPTTANGGAINLNSPHNAQTILGIEPSSSGVYSIIARATSDSGGATATCSSPLGNVIFANNTAVFTITNTIVSPTSFAFVTPLAISAGCYIESVVCTLNTITITLNAASASGLTVNFLVMNPS